MEPLEIVEKLKEKFAAEIIEVSEFRGQVAVSVKPGKITDMCRYLHDDPDLYLDYLEDLCGVDYPDRKYLFEVVYNLFSIKHRHRILVKALIQEKDPNVDTVVPIWAGANWHEREVCDMFGIVFNGHPDLRRILMPEDWEGFPLRKDYPLKGPEGAEYKGLEELKVLHSHDKEWNIQS